MFGKLSKMVPRNALYATVVAGLCFLSSMYGNQTVYLWLLNTSGMTGFIAWLGIAISHYRFRKGYVAQGRDLNDLIIVPASSQLVLFCLYIVFNYYIRPELPSFLRRYD